MPEHGTAYLNTQDRDALISRWSEPHRKYHDVRHLNQVISSLSVLRSAGTPFDEEAVQLAAWFHDSVYEIGSPDNEEKSASLAETMLTGRACAPEVARLVRVTATHTADICDQNAAALCDADLSILASSPSEYAAYNSSVRDEYSAVEDDAYKAGRTTVLNHLLDMDSLYKTDYGRAHWERRARENLRDELAQLRG